MRGEFARGEAIVERIDRARSDTGNSDPWGLFGGPVLMAFLGGDHAKAGRLAREWVDEARAADDDYWLADGTFQLGTVEWSMGDVASARPHFEEAIETARQWGNFWMVSFACVMLAVVLAVDDEDGALAAIDEAIQVGAKLDDLSALAVAEGTHAQLLVARGDWAGALTAAQNARRNSRRGNGLGILDGTFVSAILALTGLGRHDPAAILRGARANPGYRTFLLHLTERQLGDCDATLRDALTADFDALHLQGAALTPSEAVTFLADLDLTDVDVG